MHSPEKVKYPPNSMLNIDFLLGGNKIPSIPLKRESSSVAGLHRERMNILRYILHNVDRNSMAHSRETRVPFLDHNLVEFCLRLPSVHKMKGGVSKRVLRESVHDVVPEVIRHRVDKQGYSSPVKKWSENELSSFFRDNLHEAVKRRAFVKKSAVLNSFTNYTAKKTHFDPVWWRIIAADHWMEMFGL